MRGFEVLFFCGCKHRGAAMVARFPYIIPEEFANKPLLKREDGRGGDCRDESEGERVQGLVFNIQRAFASNGGLWLQCSFTCRKLS
jgi:hypothetical protein